MGYTKPKCFNCQVTANCKICKKRKQCDLYKVSQLHDTLNYSKSQKYDICVYRKKHCQCISKQYYATCTIKKKKYINYKKLLPKCTLNNKFKIITSFLFYKL